MSPTTRKMMDGSCNWYVNTLVFGLLFFVVWLAPRWGAILENPLTFDDFAHTYLAHLGTGRPLLALEGWLGDILFGGDYMASRAPMLLSGLWLATTAVILAWWLKTLGSPYWLAILALCGWLLHPAINELSLWKVTSGANFSLLLTVVGSVGLTNGKLQRTKIIGAALVSVGALGSQIFVLTPLMLAILYLIAKPVDGLRKWQIASWAIGATVAAIGVALTSKFLLEALVEIHHDPRGIVDVSNITRDFLVTQLKNMSNILANLSQPSFGFLFSVGAAWSSWEWPYLILMALATVFVVSDRESSLIKKAVIITAPVFLPIIVSLIWLGIQPAQSNLRVCVPAILAVYLVLPAIVASASKDSCVQVGGKVAASAVIIIFSGLQYIATAADANIRVAAYKDVLRVEQEARFLIKNSELNVTDVGFTSTLLDKQFQSKPKPDERVMVVSYHAVRQESYLPFGFWFFWKGFAERAGMKPILCEKADSFVGCVVGDGCNGSGPASEINGLPLRLVLDVDRRVITLCEHGVTMIGR